MNKRAKYAALISGVKNKKRKKKQTNKSIQKLYDVNETHSSVYRE